MKVTAKTFIEFIKHTDQLSRKSEIILFRGQAHQGKLLPGIARHNPNKDTTMVEKKVLDQLQLQGSSHLNGVGSTALDILVLAQHYGLKTRLLDWTSNPLVALWFACFDLKEGDAFIYALEADTFLEKNVYKKDPFSTTKTRAFQARLNNERIIAQEGWFTLHKFSNRANRFVPLETNPEVRGHIHRIRIPEAQRADLLNSLDRHGVNARTLLPDLSGLCKHLNFKYELSDKVT